jgi:hypothetical protein
VIFVKRHADPLIGSPAHHKAVFEESLLSAMAAK